MPAKTNKARCAAYFEAHREGCKASWKAYRETHREENKARCKAYHEAHRDEDNARRSAQYQRDREKVLQHLRTRRVADPVWQAMIVTRRSKAERARYAADPVYREKKTAENKRSRQQSPAYKARVRHHRDNLTDEYVRGVLAQYWNTKHKLRRRDFPRELVELKRAELRLKHFLNTQHPTPNT